MTTFAAVVDALSGSAVDALIDFDEQLAVRAGLDPAQINAWAGVREVYFGTTAFTRKQADALRLARAGSFSLHQLVLVERRLARVGVERDRWALRLELLSRPGTYRAVEHHARDIVPAEDRTPEDGVRFSQSKAGTRRMTATGDEHILAAVEHALRADLDKTKPTGPQMFARLTDMLTGDGGVHVPVPRPIMPVPLDVHTTILGGCGDDVLLGLSDGTTMTGAEYLQRWVGEHFPHELALVHPEVGPVNLYRTQRFANAKQRDLARLATPMCPVPGCRVGADLCEMHHIVAWSQGGKTNLANLVPLCRYHNRANQDDPSHANRHGRIERIRGRPVWVSPNGYAVLNPLHPYGVMEWLFGAIMTPRE